MRNAILLLLLLPAAVGCRSAYYSTMESFGVHKRDILKDRVQEGREEQVEAKEQFQTTLEAFQAVTGFQGGELEKVYKKLNSEYEDSEDSAEQVRERITSIERVATDLFKEWQGEIEQMSSPDMQQKSKQMLLDTQSRYEQVVSKMRVASKKMDPVLESFKDRVLLLKHNLNAQAISSLREDEIEIQNGVDSLIRDMQASIDEADAFIASMEGA